MTRTKAKRVLAVGIFLHMLLLAGPSLAQGGGTVLSGKVTTSAGAPIPDAKISVKNTATSLSSETQTDSSGAYRLENLVLGVYDLSATADGFETLTEQVTITGEAVQSLNLTLTPSLSLGSLGFSQTQIQGNAEEQVRLDKRSRMLKIHQKLGLITAIPLAATVISGFFSGGKNVTSSRTRDLHVALGSVTAGLYFTTAYYAIFAPKIHGTKSAGPIRWHKALAWIHGPGMILTPIMGEMAFAQRSNGERVHGFAHYHGQVAIVTAAAYGLAILPVTIKSGIARKTAHAAFFLFRSHHSPAPESDYALETDKEAEQLAKDGKDE